MPTVRCILLGCACTVLLTAPSRCLAAEVKIAAPAVEAEAPVSVGVAAPAVSTGAMPTVTAKPSEGPGKPDEGKPPESDKPGEGPGKGKPGDKNKPADEPKVVQRPTAPPKTPDPTELKIRPDESGKVRLSFNGQPWQGVLEWLAEISGMSLDWQELPGDYLNLTTRQSYTVREARDLINRHLLARGFTMLRQGEVLTVANIKKLDPSMVPRLEPDELASRDPHEFAKVSLALKSLVAETAVDELKPMLSPNGKLTALVETNRIEAMDAVSNLSDIAAVLKEQQSGDGAQRQVREFKLRYARPADVHQLLSTLLGLESKPSGMPGMQPGQSPEQMQAQMMAHMQQNQGQGGPGGQQPPKPPKSVTVTLAVNERRNSILANARPDKMAVIAQVIEAVDVPLDRQGSLLANMDRMQVYRLAGIEPEPVVKTLRDIGNLDPATRLEVDSKNHAIIVNGPLADHVTIRALVDKLTGSERRFEVVRLRHLSAEAVAGSIDFMLGTGQKKEKSRSSGYFFGGYDSSRKEQSEATKAFHVDADVEHNRLLLWANAAELTAVQELLVKLGEMPAKGGSEETARVVETGGDAKETAELIERIRKAWPTVGKNPLEVGPAPVVPPGNPATPSPTTVPEKKTSSPPQAAVPIRSASLVALRTAEPAEAPAAGPPVMLTVTPDGKLMISSHDIEALNRLEDLAARLATPPKDFKVFHLKYAWAVGVALNLQDFFKEEKKEKRQMPWYYYDYSDNSSDEDSANDDRRLSRRKKLRLISDADTNTILVEGADASQLRTIDELVKLYDQPPPTDSQSVRKTEIIHLKYSKAKNVAETVKDVYRDLLSANDKALGDQHKRESQRSFVFSYSDSDKSEQKTPKFKGLLSIGIDELSNSLAVSAPAYLFDVVTKMIKDLDEEAAPHYTVQVLRIGPGTTPSHVQDVLTNVFGEQVKGTKHSETSPTAPTGPKPRAKSKGKDGSKSARSRTDDNSK